MNAKTVPDFAQRVVLAGDAAGEVMSLAMLLQRQFKDDVGSELEWVRGASIRLESLASVILSALDDENEPVQSIRGRFYGPEAERLATRAGAAA